MSRLQVALQYYTTYIVGIRYVIHLDVLTQVVGIVMCSRVCLSVCSHTFNLSTTVFSQIVVVPNCYIHLVE